MRTRRSYISLFCFIFFQPLLVQAWIQTEGWDNQWLNLVLVCISMRLLFSSTFPLFLNFFPLSFHSFPLLSLFVEIQPFNERPPFKEPPSGLGKLSPGQRCPFRQGTGYQGYTVEHPFREHPYDYEKCPLNTSVSWMKVMVFFKFLFFSYVSIRPWFYSPN